MPQLGNTGSVKSLIFSLALLWLSKASLGMMPTPGNHAHPMPEDAAGYVREGCVPTGIPRGVCCLGAGRVRGCPKAVKLPPRGPSSVPLQFGRELHGGKYDRCQAGGRSRRGGAGRRSGAPGRGAAPDAPFGQLRGPRLSGRRRVGAGPGLHFPYCPSALMYAVLSPAPCV